MKIAFISQGLGRIDPPVASGSISIWTYEVINELRKTHEVIAYEMDGSRLRSEIKEHNGVIYFYAPTGLNRLINRYHQAVLRRLNRLKLWRQSPDKPFFGSIIHNLGYILWVAWYLRSQRCGVIHIHQFSQYVPIVRLFNRNSKIVIHMNCEWLSQLNPQMIQRRLKYADGIIGASAYIVGKIERRFPKLKQKCDVVYNGADVGLFAPSEGAVPQNPSDALNILFVGRVSPEKGAHVLLDAFKVLADEFPTARVEFVGGVGSLPQEFLVSMSDDPLVRELKEFYGTDYLVELRKRLPDTLTERVIFHGNQPHREVAESYRRATVFVNSSLSDAFPLPVVEAMAAGLPVVASAVGGIPEAVADGKTGILVKPNKPEELAAALRLVLGDANLRRQMSAAARARALELFSWRAIAERLLQVYNRMERRK